MTDSRYKLPTETRRFSDKVFKYLVIGNREEADRDKERWQKRGFSVRIIRWRRSGERQFAVYTRKDKS